MDTAEHRGDGSCHRRSPLDRWSARSRRRTEVLAAPVGESTRNRLQCPTASRSRPAATRTAPRNSRASASRGALRTANRSWVTASCLRPERARASAKRVRRSTRAGSAATAERYEATAARALPRFTSPPPASRPEDPAEQGPGLDRGSRCRSASPGSALTHGRDERNRHEAGSKKPSRRPAPCSATAVVRPCVSGSASSRAARRSPSSAYSPGSISPAARSALRTQAAPRCSRTASPAARRRRRMPAPPLLEKGKAGRASPSVDRESVTIMCIVLRTSSQAPSRVAAGRRAISVYYTASYYARDPVCRGHRRSGVFLPSHDVVEQPQGRWCRLLRAEAGRFGPGPPAVACGARRARRRARC